MTDQHAPARSVLTVGHSNHSLDKFLGLLRGQGVALLVDVRSQPASRFSPHFARRALERAVTASAIGYVFLGDALGGRPRSRACYDAAGTVDYDRVAVQDFYRQGIAELLEHLARSRVCVLCSEEDPARCHRRLLITRTLVDHGVDVQHLRGTGALEAEAALRARGEPTQLSLLGRR